MKLEIILPNIEPISLNNSQKISTIGKFAKKYKTADTKVFESIVNNLLRKYRVDINKFNNYYEEKKHYLVASYRFFKPIFIKDGSRISKTSGDNSNTIKNLEDIIFKQLIADDSQVVDLNVTKVHSKDIRTEITITIKELRHIQ